MTGTIVAVTPLHSEAFSRGARMLRTALGLSITAFPEDPSIVEVMLNPDGRPWIDRLSGGLEHTLYRQTVRPPQLRPGTIPARTAGLRFALALRRTTLPSRQEPRSKIGRVKWIRPSVS